MKPDHERIWLQPGAGDCGETTWCQDRIHDDDIEYIRADIHARALLEAHQRGRREGVEDAGADIAERLRLRSLAINEALVEQRDVDAAVLMSCELPNIPAAAILAKAQEVET